MQTSNMDGDMDRDAIRRELERERRMLLVCTTTEDQSDVQRKITTAQKRARRPNGRNPFRY